MNSYERYMGVLNGKPVDILPRLPILMAYAANYIGSNYGAFASDYRILVEANLRCAKDFGFDQLSVISDPYRETQGFGAEIEFLKDAVPRCLRPPLENTTDLSVLQKPDPCSSPRMADRIKAVENFTATAAGEYSILGWVEGPAAEAADLRGVSNFLIDLMEEETFCHELMNLCVEAGSKFAEAQLKAGADTIGIGDAIVSQVSPKIYESLIFPHQKELIEDIHRAGGIVRLHICGNITHLLSKIALLGADIVDLDWMVDVVKARQILGERTVLAGNLNPVTAVQNGDPVAIEKRIREIYQAIGNPYMVGGGCEIPAGTPRENLKALCKPVPYKESVFINSNRFLNKKDWV